MPDRIADALDGLGEVQHELAVNLGTLAGDLARAEARRRREARQYKVALALLLMLVVGLTVAMGLLTRTAGDNRQTLQAVQGATGPAAQVRQVAATRKILFDNAVETDCRSRRQQARLPAPASAPAPPAGLKGDALAKYFDQYSCVAQTPPDVYPGLVGQPAKGTP